MLTTPAAYNKKNEALHAGIFEGHCTPDHAGFATPVTHVRLPTRITMYVRRPMQQDDERLMCMRLC